MPAAIRTNTTIAYNDCQHASGEHYETNDCTVVAISLATDTPYDQVHQILRELGRKKGKGTSISNMVTCCRLLGFVMRPWSFAEYHEVLAAYPKSWKATVITTHQPRRCPKAWAPYANRTFIFHTSRHVAAVIGAKVHDWSINNSLRVNTIYEIYPR